MTLGLRKYIWPLELPDHTYDPRVLKARHALAIDEERTSFAPELWEEAGGQLPSNTKDKSLSQVWFSGVHANVGGGYPDNSLANVSLSWMMAEAADCGLQFKKWPEADPDAVKHVNASQDKDGRLARLPCWHRRLLSLWPPENRELVRQCDKREGSKAPLPGVRRPCSPVS